MKKLGNKLRAMNYIFMTKSFEGLLFLSKNTQNGEAITSVISWMRSKVLKDSKFTYIYEKSSF